MIDSLQLLQGEHLLFKSSSHWLYPLFELEDFLQTGNLSPESLFLKDRIAGRAAASLMIRLGIRKCHIGLVSQKALDLYERYQVEYTYDRKVEKIDCRTEDWIEETWSLDHTWLFLKKRAGRIQGHSLKLESLSTAYDERVIVDDLNLEVPAGEQLVLRGDNGSGKTTLLRCILGLQPLRSGRIWLGDTLLGSAEWKRNRHITGFLPQQNSAAGFPVSAGEVAAMGLAALGLKKEEALYRWEIALRQTGAFHLKDRLWDELSGGEKQRLSLARCLCQNAKILLIDEPTSYLDREGKASLLEALQNLVLDLTPTVVLVSHDDKWLQELNWPTRELRDGRLC